MFIKKKKQNKTIIAIIFPKDSEALFNVECSRTFGGASVQLYNIAKELYSYDTIKVISLIPHYKSIKFDDSKFFHFHYLYNEKDAIIVKMIKMVIFLISYKPDFLIQRGLTYESCLLALLCRILHVKMVFMFAHDVEVKGLKQKDRKPVRLIKLLLHNSYKIITQNQYQKEMLLKEYGKDSTIIYSGYQINKAEFKKKDKIVLWVARCERWKQPEKFIELAMKNQSIPFIMICSKGNENEYYQYIKRYAAQAKNIEFIDFVPYNDILKYFKKSFIFINTSLYEGFPQTFIQSLICAVPIISLIVDPENFIKKNNCGIVCDGDFMEMNSALLKMLKNTSYYKKISENALKYAIQNHNIVNTVRNLLHTLNIEYKN